MCSVNTNSVVKDWLLIAFSWSIIKDEVIVINLIGYGLAFLAVCYYNHLKLHALKANDSQPKHLRPTAEADDEEEGLITKNGRLSNRDSETEIQN